MSSERYHDRNDRNQEVDDPPFSRLFVLGDKRATEEDYMEEFGKIGVVQYIKTVKDRRTGEPKGLVYIKMSKTSEAARAVEQLNGRSLGRHNRAMKVLIASNRSSEFSQSDEEIIAQLSRLFVIVPKTFTEEEIQETFQKYGQVTKVMIIREKNSGSSKGLAFVTFSKASSAAQAYEECDASFRPKFADPINRKRQHDDMFHDKDEIIHHSVPSRVMSPILQPPHRFMSGGGHSMAMSGPMEFLSSFPHQDNRYLIVRVAKSVTQMQLTRLFNIVPTLEYCKMVAVSPYSNADSAIVKYSSPQCCAYAKETMNGLEYPPGSPIELDFYHPSDIPIPTYNPIPPRTCRSPDPMIFKQNQGMSAVYSAESAQTYLKGKQLPPVMPLTEHADMVKRLFIVTQPERLPQHLLRDLFCRFGNLIHISYMPGKNCGFAKFGSEESALAAQKFLHGQELLGIRLKVLDAEDPRDDSHKRSRKESSEINNTQSAVATKDDM